MAGLVIRPAETPDLPAIVDIQNALMDTTYEWTETPHTLEEWTARLAEKAERDEPVLVVDDGGTVVGWTTYGDFRDATRWPGYRFTVEHTILLADSHRGRGLGRLMLESLMDTARRQGKRVMVAAIDSSNEGSLAFHARMGFIEVARMPGVGDKWGQRLDLVLMQRDLLDPLVDP